MANWGQGSTRAWRKTRSQVLRRDDHQCQLRLSPDCEGQATEVHHVVGIAASGRMRCEAIDPSECIAACTTCHRIVTAQQAVAGRRTGRRKQRVHPADATL